MYFPWRNEDELEDMPLFKTKFESVFSCMEATIQKYEPYIEEVLAASEICESLEASEEMWDQILPQVEQDRKLTKTINFLTLATYHQISFTKIRMRLM